MQRLLCMFIVLAAPMSEQLLLAGCLRSSLILTITRRDRVHLFSLLPNAFHPSSPPTAWMIL